MALEADISISVNNKPRSTSSAYLFHLTVKKYCFFFLGGKRPDSSQDLIIMMMDEKGRSPYVTPGS